MQKTEKTKIIEDYARHNRRKNAFILSLFFLILCITTVSLSLGSFQINILEVYSIISRSLFEGYDPGKAKETVVLILRLPRVAMGILAGLGLGVAGAVMQGILRNPLASPTTIGVSAAAGLGAALAILVNVGITEGKFLLIGNAFVFSMIPTFVIFLLARLKQSTPEMMILAGIGMLYIFTSFTSLLQFFAAENALKSMVVWMMGDLGRAQWLDILATFILVASCVAFLIWKASDLNVMNVGDETAKSLGIDPDRTRVVLMAVASLITSTVICFTGMIGFIGLVSPHICRIIIGSDNRFLIPASGIFGAAFLLFADAVARTVIAPVIIPVGIITACAGGPLFLYLIINMKKRHW